MGYGLKILAVDDEALNLDIMQEYFEDAKLDSTSATDGLQALKELEKDSSYDVIVLDRMMPNMDGMEFLAKIKNDSRFKDIPVIMQTAATSSTQISEGIKAGVFYYLSKPYTKELFLSVIKAANEDAKRKESLKVQLKEYGQAMSMIQEGEFIFSTINQARSLAILLGSSLPSPEMIIVGLTELMVNAVEHGNLGLTYEEKKQLKLNGNWEEEIEKRQHLLKNKDKFCKALIKRNKNGASITIKDQGEGFDWKKFETIDPSRLLDPNGKGIAMTMHSGFDEVKYVGNGNEVICKLKL